MRPLLTALVVLLAGATPARVVAQEPRDADGLTRAVRAYQNLDFDGAAIMLRRVLAAALSDAERARALTYLGATEYYRGRRDSAIAVFRRLVRFAPRHRPDTLIFPPEVTRVYNDVRSRTKVVTVGASADTVLDLGGRFVAWLYASSPHDVTVAVTRDDGRPLRSVYTGAIGDSLDVRWDGRDSVGAIATGDRLWLTIVSPSQLLRVPLRIELRGADTLPHPPPLTGGDLLAERADRGTGWRALGGGLLLGAGALALPALVAPGDKASGTRFAVAGALGVSGLIGYLAQPAGRPLDANVAVNRARRDQWRRQDESVRRANAERLRNAQLRIRSGAGVVVERSGGPS